MAAGITKFKAVTRAGLLACVGFAMSACAAGHIESFSKPAEEVMIGLSEPQVELRVQAKAIQRTPWKSTAGADAFSVTKLFGILVDGVEAETAPEAANHFAGADSLTGDALTYASALEEIASANERVDALRGHLGSRIKITRKFLTAASKVVAGMHVMQDEDVDPAVHREDLALISEGLDSLKTQRDVFSEVASVYAENGVALDGLSEVEGALLTFRAEIEALETLRRSITSGRFS